MLKFLFGANVGFLLGSILMITGFGSMSVEQADQARSLLGNKEAHDVLVDHWKWKGVKEYKEYKECKKFLEKTNETEQS